MGGLPARFMSLENREGYYIKIGNLGTLKIDCTGQNCGDAVERYLKRMDLKRITEFVEFPHEGATESAEQQ